MIFDIDIGKIKIYPFYWLIDSPPYDTGFNPKRLEANITFNWGSMKSWKKFLSTCFLGLTLSQSALAQDTFIPDPNLAVFGFYTLYHGAK